MPKMKKLRRPIKPLRKISDEKEVDEDDLEIKRLERLLKIDVKKGRKEAAAKLNREFEEFEGIGGGLGDFLMELDDLTQDLKKQKKKSERRAINEMDDDDDDDPTIVELNEDEIDKSEDADEFNNHKMDREEESSDEEDEEEDDYENENDVEEERPMPIVDSTSTYQPVAGEDIYGRVVDPAAHAVANTAKYIPPSKRKLTEIDNVRIFCYCIELIITFIIVAILISLLFLFLT